MKLICTGLLKTGTKSIAKALQILGYKIYDFEEHLFYNMDEWLELFNHGKAPDFYTMFKDVDAVIGSPTTLFFEELMEAFPDAKVLLSVREENAWLRSLKKHLNVNDNLLLTKIKNFVPTFKKVSFVITNLRMANLGAVDPNSSYICRKRYRWHNDRVKSVVPPDKLLVYSVQQGWQPLCDFTGTKIPDQPFPRLNVKGEVFRTFVTETELGKKIEGELRLVTVCFVAMVVALIGIALFYLF